jgi:hypothetical protein
MKISLMFTNEHISFVQLKGHIFYIIYVFSLSKNDELNPITLKFKTKMNYCSRHFPSQKRVRVFPFISSFLNQHLNSPVHRGLKSNESILLDDNLNGTCLDCLKEDPNLAKFSETREQKYNSQLVPMYKYHIVMCFLIFLAITVTFGILGLLK